MGHTEGTGRTADRRGVAASVDLDGDELRVAGRTTRVDATDPEAVLGGYVALLGELRRSRPGEPLHLRAADLEALAHALGTDGDDVEARIVAIVGCTPHEADRLAGELRRRKLLVPVAALALGIAAAAGVVGAERGDPPEARVTLVQPAAAATPDTSPVARPVPPPTTTPATPAPPRTPATVADPALGSGGDPPATAPEPGSPRPSPSPPPPAPPATSSRPVPPPPPAPPVRTEGTRPDEPDIGIPPGEVFVEADPVTGEPVDP